MGSLSMGHWIIVLCIVLLLFGAGKIPRIMGDFATGIRSFRKGLADTDPDRPAPPADRGTESRPSSVE